MKNRGRGRFGELSYRVRKSSFSRIVKLTRIFYLVSQKFYFNFFLSRKKLLIFSRSCVFGMFFFCISTVDNVLVELYKTEFCM